MDLDNWYAVHTRSRHEERVADRLERKRFDIFLPRLNCWSKRKDRRKRIRVPMFPGYLFIHCDMTNDCWLDIVKTDGVAGIVGYERQPAVIPPDQIKSLSIVDVSNIEAEPYPLLRQGDRVMVVRGPLAGAVGILIDKREHGHSIVINVEAIGQAVTVHIDGSMVERVSGTALFERGS